MRTAHVIAHEKPVFDMIAALLSRLGIAVSQSESSPDALIVTAADNNITLSLGGKSVIFERPFDIKAFIQSLSHLLEPEAERKTERYTVDEETRIVSYKDSSVKLTKRELGLFIFLNERIGDAVTRSEISEKLWNGDSSNSCEVYMHRLRQKLDAAFSPGTIITVRDSYILRLPPEKAID